MSAGVASLTERSRQLPLKWVEWALAVEELLQALLDYLASCHPKHKRTGIFPRDALCKCVEAASTVGSDRDRLRVSVALHRSHNEVIQLAEKLHSSPPSNGAFEDREWLTLWSELHVPINRLRSPDVLLEMEEAALRHSAEHSSDRGRSDKPHWDGTTLTYWGISKRYRQPASDQRLILQAFQDAGWEPRIPNPLKHKFRSSSSRGDKELAMTKIASRKAVDHLNRNLRDHKPPVPIEFLSDGGEFIGWRHKVK